MKDFAYFRDLLEKTCGLVFENEKSMLLEAGIRARMAARSVHSADHYRSILIGERDELSELIELLTVNETYFYRDPNHFTLLTENVIPELLDHGTSSDRLTFLSAGCSTGEEAYSILISLAECFGREGVKGMTVIGVDIDTRAITRAKEGVFGRRSFRDFPEDLCDKYFDEISPGVWRVHEWLRESIAFLPLNLVGVTYPPELSRADVIFYRNVSIYFSREVRKGIFVRLAGILNNGGYLFVSPSETFFHNRSVLSLVAMDGAFLFKKDAGHRQSEDCGIRDVRGEPAAVKPSGAGFPSKPMSLGSGRGDVLHRRLACTKDQGPALPDTKAARQASGGEHHETLAQLDGVIERSPDNILARTLKGVIQMKHSLLDDAQASFREVQAFDRFSLDASFSLGLISRIKGDVRSALEHLREAVYIQPSSWPAHYYLAETHLERGEIEPARREYEVTLKILDNGDFHNHGLTDIPFTFSALELETLCRRKLQTLKRASNGA
ncbi:MAG: CheR family methyltransferase [Geobacteraceae bacterium]|nr:CheR family methyltransferase [Geobacteraceae bacterium]